MSEKIRTDQVLTDEQVADVRAAIALAGYPTQKAYAEDRNLSEPELSKVLRKRLIPNERYANELNRLIGRHLSARKRVPA